MIIPIDEVQVYFPYETVYPEQLAYMRDVKRVLDGKGNGVLEMPTGTGKTISLLALVTAYQLTHPEVGRLVYCTRTVPEINKVLEECKTLFEYQKSQGVANDNMLAIGMTSRKNYCVHPSAFSGVDRSQVDQVCRSMTASFIREQRKAQLDVAYESSFPSCVFYEGYLHNKDDIQNLKGVYTIEDFGRLGRGSGDIEELNPSQVFCPYFSAKTALGLANVVVLNYQYLLNPRIASTTPLFDSERPLAENSILVFDEGHNIDEICIEAFSVHLTKDHIDDAQKSLKKLSKMVTEEKDKSENRLIEEYKRLLAGLVDGGRLNDDECQELQTPLLPVSLRDKTVPGAIRKAEHFVMLLSRFIEFIKEDLKTETVKTTGIMTYGFRLETEAFIEGRTLKFMYERFKSIMQALEVVDTSRFAALSTICDLASMLAGFQQGFAIILDPYPNVEGLFEPTFQLACLDSSLAMKPLNSRFESIILTSGTLSPLDVFPKILGLPNVLVSKSYEVLLEKPTICPLVVTRGDDSSHLSSRFSRRHDPCVLTNYGHLIVALTRTVPDGICVFFPSYRYMDVALSHFYTTGVIAQIYASGKLLFMETRDVLTTTVALNKFRHTCDIGRGAVFFSVARGKVAEGVDFEGHYGRCVILCGVPFQYTLSYTLRSRLEFILQKHQIKETEFLEFDAMRQVSQCLGRVVRTKSDYSIMILADNRFSKESHREKLPRWIRQHLEPVNLTPSSTVIAAANFLKTMYP